MKKKLLLSVLALSLSLPAFAADTVIRTDKVKFGRPGTATDKAIEFDINQGVDNPKLASDPTDEDLQLQSDTVRVGVPAAGNKTLDFNIGSGATNPKLRWNNTTSKIEFSNNGTDYSSVGAGSGTGINYVSNGDGEAGGTLGWATYDDGSTATPIDGTGGSPGLTFTRTTTTPLRGTGHFLITKDAADRQGEGASYDFTIAKTDQAKVLTVAFDYEVVSGTYDPGSDSTDPDLTAYVYGPTDGTPELHQLAPFKVLGLTIGQHGNFQGSFQTAATGSVYRLILHEAKTGVSSFVFALDDVSVGPDSKSFGPPVTDSLAYTPTLTNFTATVNHSSWSRVGEKMRITGFLTLITGVPTGVLTVSLPAGYSIDTTKLNADGDQTIGLVYASDVTANKYTGNVRWNSATSFDFIGPNTAGRWNATIPFTWAVGDIVSYQVEVPIVGWSSTVQMSNDADTRVVRARATSSESVANTTIGTPVKLSFNTESYDSHAAFDSTTNYRFVAPSPGNYAVTAAGNQAASDGMSQLIRIYKNGVQYGNSSIFKSGGSGTSSVRIADEVDLVAGDYLEIFYGHDHSGGAQNVTGQVSVKKATGPSQIAASEKIFAKYTTPATTSMTTATDYYISFQTAVKDSHGSVLGFGGGHVTTTNTGWRFIAPRADGYRVCSYTALNTATGFNGTSERVLLESHVNGVVSSVLARVVPATGDTTANLNGCTTEWINAGDRIELAYQQNSGGSLSMLASGSYFVTIESVGGP